MDGRRGNDVLHGLGGGDVLVGGDGTDVVRYFVSDSAGELRLIDLGDRRADVRHPNGDVDRLYGVEIIRFEAFEEASQYSVVTNQWGWFGDFGWTMA